VPDGEEHHLEADDEVLDAVRDLVRRPGGALADGVPVPDRGLQLQLQLQVGVQQVCSGRAVGVQWACSGRAVGVQWSANLPDGGSLTAL
jgi:hypothetical protein